MDYLPYINTTNMLSLLGLLTFPVLAPVYLAAIAMTVKHFIRAPLTKECFKPWIVVSLTVTLVLVHGCVAVSGVLTAGYLIDVVPAHLQTVFEASQPYVR